MANINQIINACDIGIIILDNEFRIKYWNDWLNEYTGIKEKFAINKTLKDIFNNDISPYLLGAIDNAILNGRSAFLSPRLHKHPLPIYRESRDNRGKELIYQKIVVSCLEDQNGQRNCLLSISDVTASIQREKALQLQTRELKLASAELIKSEQEIRNLAFRDSLTSLANRSLFNDRLTMAINQAKRQKEKMGIMLIDIDYFKQINDKHGHDVGDALLIEIANRLKQCVRQSDTVARLGGDEFAIIQPQLNNIEGAATLASKIRDSISKPVMINDKIIQTSPSIGVSVFPNDADNHEELLKNADLAMYIVKQNGRANWQFYSDTMRTEQKKRQQQYDSLVKAINSDRIIVHYQPQISLQHGRVDAFEALVRYLDVKDKIVMPDHFIPIAEESGLINNITDAILENICQTDYFWKKFKSSSIAINLSSIQFRDSDLIKRIKNAHDFLKKKGSSLEVELTESILMENTEYAVETLNKIAELDISIALDDFGTGYSSLEYLRRFPVSKLKIDRSFISDITNKNQNDNVLTNTIISLGHNLGMKVVAEGVESRDQHNYLLNRQCDSAQGFYYSTPLHKKEIHDFHPGEMAA